MVVVVVDVGGGSGLLAEAWRQHKQNSSLRYRKGVLALSGGVIS